MILICPNCNSNFSDNKEDVERYNELAKAFPNSHIEFEESSSAYYVDYDRMGQEYSVIRLVFINKLGQWKIKEAFIATQDFDFRLDTPQKFWTEPKRALDDCLSVWQRDVED